MQSLKEILVDAARYRWVRENRYTFLNWIDIGSYKTPQDVDVYIDDKLKAEND